MKVLTPREIAALKAKALEDTKDKEIIDDKYFVLKTSDIIPDYNTKHPTENKVLYKSICIPSAINGYSLAIEYMKQWFLSKLPENMFPEESINIDGKNIFDDYRRLSRQQLLARKKPSLTIVPNINWEFDNDKIDTDMFGLNVYSPTGFWKGSFFKDYNHDMYLGVIMKVLMMQFQFRIRVETRAEQMDLYEFMRLAYRVSYSTGEYSDIDIHIPSGAVVGILGGTGSGKSSLVQLIPRLYDTTSGAVKVGGVDTREYDLTALRDSVAMVLQKNELFSGTIKDNLRWGNENATDEEMEEACRLAQADGFIRDFPDGYDTWIEQGGTNVSGGQKQRLCIARALLKKPKILILDDSTSAVDTRTDAQIRAGFRSYIPDTTKLIIAQRVASVQDADLIIVLDNGKIADTGTHAELLERCEIYREVYDSQTKGGEDHE